MKESKKSWKYKRDVNNTHAKTDAPFWFMHLRRNLQGRRHRLWASTKWEASAEEVQPKSRYTHKRFMVRAHKMKKRQELLSFGSSYQGKCEEGRSTEGVTLWLIFFCVSDVCNCCT